MQIKVRVTTFDQHAWNTSGQLVAPVKQVEMETEIPEMNGDPVKAVDAMVRLADTFHQQESR